MNVEELIKQRDVAVMQRNALTRDMSNRELSLTSLSYMANARSELSKNINALSKQIDEIEAEQREASKIEARQREAEQRKIVVEELTAAGAEPTFVWSYDERGFLSGGTATKCKYKAQSRSEHIIRKLALALREAKRGGRLVENATQAGHDNPFRSWLR